MMTMKLKTRSSCLVFTMLLPLSFSAYGDPSIERVESDGSTVTIKGDELGGHDLEVAVLDSVENRMVTEEANFSASLEYDEFWNQLGSPWANPLTPEEHDGPSGHEGNATYFGESKSFNGWPSIMDGKTNRSLYVSWWFKPSESPSHSGGSNKFIRIWDDSDGKGSRISWTQMHLTYNEEASDWNGWEGEVGQWNLMEIYVDSDAGSIETWVNGKLTHDIDDFKKAESEKGLTIGLIGFDASFPDDYPDMEIDIDDIYFSSSRERVVVSKKEVWDEARKEHHAVLPLTWENSEIEVEIPDMISENVNNYYFYVVDNKGNANDKGVSVCEDCPEAVSNLRVE